MKAGSLRPPESVIFWISLSAHEPLVYRAVPADGLAHVLCGLLFRSFFGSPASDDVGADAPGFPVAVGDVRVHDGEAALGLLLALGRVRDEVALLEDLRDSTVGQLDGTSGIVHEDPLDLFPPLLVAPAALLGERLHLPLDPPTALPKLPLGLLLGAPFLSRPLVLAPEFCSCPLPLLLAPLYPSAPHGEVDRQQHYHDNHHHDDHDQRRSTHTSSSCRVA